MISTLSLFEIELIMKGSHSDPHSILGMHEVKEGETGHLIVRAFIPGAKKITCFDAEIPGKQGYELEPVHKDGFFEAVITDRHEWFLYEFEIEDFSGNTKLCYDPYSFSPGISDYDIYLFTQGNHYEIYGKLGSRLTCLNGVEGALFGVWAPNAKRVSVIGDFNNWNGKLHAMRNLNKSGVWEIFIPKLHELDKYKFEIKTMDGTIVEKSDPYGFFRELRPSSSSLIYNIDNYKWKDEKWLENRNNYDPFRSPVNIYEVHLGAWKRVEEEENRYYSYKELTDELIPYVKEMGYTHIELMPIAEYPFDGSWGYQVTGYYSPTSRYGSPAEFMAFVDACHNEGIGVIMDWVPAHFPKDADGLVKFDGTALYEHENPVRGEHPDWGTLIFNFGRNEVKNFLIANALFWVEKYHIDGIRVDAVASMLYLDYGSNRKEFIPNPNGGREDYEAVEFMKHLNSVMLRRNRNILMIAEESTSWPGVTRPPDTGGLGFIYKWNLGWMNDFLEFMSKDPLHRRYYNNNITFSMMYNYSENFILPLSHDEVVHGKRSLLDKMPGDLWQKFANLRIAYIFMYGHPGKKLLFMGGEFGQFIEWNEKQALDWFLLEFEHHSKIIGFVKTLNKLYSENNGFWYNDFDFKGFEWINCSRPEISVFSFVRMGKTDKDTLLFVMNFTPVVRENFRVGVKKSGKYKEILNSDDEDFGGSGVVNSKIIKSDAISYDNQENSIEITLPPLGGIILKMV